MFYLFLIVALSYLIWNKFDESYKYLSLTLLLVNLLATYFLSVELFNFAQMHLESISGNEIMWILMLNTYTNLAALNILLRRSLFHIKNKFQYSYGVIYKLLLLTSIMLAIMSSLKGIFVVYIFLALIPIYFDKVFF